MITTLASLNFGDKFTLKSNGKRYQRFGYDHNRIKVKCVGHLCSTLVGNDLTKMTFATNCKVSTQK